MRSRALPSKIVGRLQERRSQMQKPPAKRTTFSAPSGTIKELRLLALMFECDMNDLIQLSVARLLEELGHASHCTVDENLLQRIKGKRS